MTLDIDKLIKLYGIRKIVKEIITEEIKDGNVVKRTVTRETLVIPEDEGNAN